MTEKSLTLFVKQARARDGYNVWCKECANAHNRHYKSSPEQKEKDKQRWKEYKAKKKEKIAAKANEYRQKHKEELAAKRKAKREQELEAIRLKERLWYAENKNAVNERKRRARAENAELYRQTNREWYAKNRDRVRSVSNAYRRSRSEFFAAIVRECRKKNPELWKRKDAERIEKITDGYVKNLIATNFGLSAQERKLIPEDMINIKRLNIKLKRELKNKEK